MIIKLFVPILLMATTPLFAADMSEAQRLLSLPELPLDSKVNPTADDISSSASCLLTPSIDIQVASPVVGVIESVRVKRGDRVRKGDVLVQLRSEVEQATLRLNSVQTEYGKRTIQRNTDLYERNLISEQEKDEIIINNQIYGYEMEQTQALLKQKTIRSPVTGVVVETFLDQGEYVGEEPIMQLVQLDPLYVEVVMPAKRYGSIKRGDRADVILDAPLNSSHKATVVVADSVLDAASGTFGVRLELPNPRYLLPAGLKCTIRF